MKIRRIDKICHWYSCPNVVELEALCQRADQRRMKDGSWDYKEDSLDTEIVNQLKTIHRSELTDDERWRIEQRIWMWYHHAVSCAIYKYKDKKKALFFVKKALVYQSRIENHPNKITLLFYNLLKGKIREAYDLLPHMNQVEKTTAEDIIHNWKALHIF